MEKLSCFVFLKLSRSLLKKRSGDLTAISGTLAPTWLSQRDRGGSGGTRLQKAGTSGSLQPVLPTDHHGSAELSFVQTDGWTNSLQRTVRLLFWVKVPITPHYSPHLPQFTNPSCRASLRGRIPGGTTMAFLACRSSERGKGRLWQQSHGQGQKGSHQIRSKQLPFLIWAHFSCHQPQPQIQTGPGLGAAQIEDKADMKDTNLAVHSDAFPSQPSPVCKTQRTANEISSWTSKPPKRCFTSPRVTTPNLRIFQHASENTFLSLAFTQPLAPWPGFPGPLPEGRAVPLSAPLGHAAAEQGAPRLVPPQGGTWLWTALQLPPEHRHGSVCLPG